MCALAWCVWIIQLVMCRAGIAGCSVLTAELIIHRADTVVDSCCASAVYKWLSICGHRLDGSIGIDIWTTRAECSYACRHVLAKYLPTDRADSARPMCTMDSHDRETGLIV